MTGLEAYREGVARGPKVGDNWERFRFVVLDCESTGFDPRRDRIVSIGGVAMREGEILLEDSFGVILPVAYNTSSVMVHGITREQAAEEGVEESEALRQFLGWLKDAVIVGHHINHDVQLLDTALMRHYGMRLGNVVVDTVLAWQALREAGGFRRRGEMEGHSLDQFCREFGILAHDRHTALGDAFLTAQLFMRLLKEGGRMGKWNLVELGAWQAGEE